MGHKSMALEWSVKKNLLEGSNYIHGTNLNLRSTFKSESALLPNPLLQKTRRFKLIKQF